MFIKLKWRNLNVGPVTTRIYRGAQELDRNNLTNPIATLTNGQVEYNDTQNLVRGNQYYYVIETSNANGKVSTLNYSAWALPYTGPGPQHLQAGDRWLGYYGTVSSSELANAEQLANAAGITLINLPVSTVVWFKFAYQGKTVFVPNAGLGNTSWNSLYQAGLVYGVDGPGPVAATTGPVNQRKILTLGANQYVARLPSISTTAIIPTSTPTTGGELGQLYRRLSNIVLADQVGENWANLPTVGDTNPTVLSLINTHGLTTHTQSTDPSVALSTTMPVGSALTSIGKTSGIGAWRPVLELI